MKLPLWRLILAIFVLAAMATVLLSLMPVYYENYQLQQSVRQLVRGPATTDDALRAAVIARARGLGLPVESPDIQITHPNGKLEIQTKYAVQIDYPLYQVEVHFHANGSGP